MWVSFDEKKSTVYTKFLKNYILISGLLAVLRLRRHDVVEQRFLCNSIFIKIRSVNFISIESLVFLRKQRVFDN